MEIWICIIRYWTVYFSQCTMCLFIWSNVSLWSISVISLSTHGNILKPTFIRQLRLTKATKEQTTFTCKTWSWNPFQIWTQFIAKRVKEEKKVCGTITYSIFKWGYKGLCIRQIHWPYMCHHHHHPAYHSWEEYALFEMQVRSADQASLQSGIIHNLQILSKYRLN